MSDWYVCMFWGGMIVFILACFFFACVYASTALDDMKKALGELRHD